MARAFTGITEEQFKRNIDDLSDEELYDAYITPQFFVVSGGETAELSSIIFKDQIHDQV